MEKSPGEANRDTRSHHFDTGESGKLGQQPKCDTILPVSLVVLIIFFSHFLWFSSRMQSSNGCSEISGGSVRGCLARTGQGSGRPLMREKETRGSLEGRRMSHGKYRGP
ncbi:hypothetical protein KC320_g167 [Hortaea werneckii]|nr:hypothetical protein KC320_g167 [Hortaea werneckii]